MIIMLFKGTSSLFFYYLIFGIIHGDPSWEGSLGIPGQNCQLERLQQGAGNGKGEEATRAGWHVHMTTATSLPSISTQGTVHLGGRKGWKQLPRGFGVGVGLWLGHLCRAGHALSCTCGPGFRQLWWGSGKPLWDTAVLENPSSDPDTLTFPLFDQKL